MEDIKLVTVVVTYNRLEKLKKALMSYELQTQRCSDIVIVNNCSTDGTEGFLEDWEQEPSKYNKHVLRTDSNLGGAGGFYSGMEYALMLKADWIWLADDDAYPEKDSFEKLYGYISTHKGLDHVSAICSTVLLPDGSICYEHRGFLSQGLYWKKINSTIDNYQLYDFKIDLLSYVGVALNPKALSEAGLCNKNFFIHFDDSEHSLRLRKYGDILCVPSIRVIHDVPVDAICSTRRNYDWKTYYGVRNSIYSYLRHHLPTALILTSRIILWQTILYFAGRINKKSIKLMMAAVWDGWKGHLGIHSMYKPGFRNDPKNK